MLKSSWAKRNGERIMKESINYQKKVKISFIERRGRKVYAEYGEVKTYSNKKQVKNRVGELRLMGYAVKPSANWPFVIMLEEI